MFILISDYKINGPEFCVEALLPTDWPAWSDANGKECLPKDSIKLPPGRWEWTTEWTALITQDTDPNGWIYSISFEGHFGRIVLDSSQIRKRCWKRIRDLRDNSLHNKLYLLSSPLCFIDRQKLEVLSKELPVSHDFEQFFGVKPNDSLDQLLNFFEYEVSKVSALKVFQSNIDGIKCIS